MSNARRVGVNPRRGTSERRVTDVDYLRWLRRYWLRRNAGWVRRYQRVAPKLLCIHRYEGAWTAYNPAGPYYGGLQMDTSFMRTYGIDKLMKYGGHDARYWSRRDQLAVGFRAVRARGFTPWPYTARLCGLL